MSVELETLRDLVRRMRAAQRDYFRTRTNAALEESKRLEREVDAVVESQARLRGV